MKLTISKEIRGWLPLAIIIGLIGVLGAIRIQYRQPTPLEKCIAGVVKENIDREQATEYCKCTESLKEKQAQNPNEHWVCPA